MSHFNQKSLIFYGIAISSVVVLFRIVTWYGTTYLKAAKTIQGQYDLTLGNGLQCPPADSLVLTIQQSGIYLGGQLQDLKSANLPEPSGDAALTLKGKWTEPRLRLQGQLRGVNICRQAVDTVEMAATFQGTWLEGQMTSPSLPEPVTFRAQLLPQVKQPSLP